MSVFYNRRGGEHLIQLRLNIPVNNISVMFGTPPRERKRKEEWERL